MKNPVPAFRAQSDRLSGGCGTGGGGCELKKMTVSPKLRPCHHTPAKNSKSRRNRKNWSQRFMRECLAARNTHLPKLTDKK